MSKSNRPSFSGDDAGGPPPIRLPQPRGFPMAQSIVALLLIAAIGYLGYFWFVKRIVVGPNQVLVLVKKYGSQSLPDGQVIIPRAPDVKVDPEGHKQWVETYGDCNGILEEVYTAGTYFRFSPFDYDRTIIDINKGAQVPPGKVGIVVKKFGQKLDDGQVMADPGRDQRGPLPIVLEPGTHLKYANPHAYEIKHVSPIQVNPGHRGVVTVMAGALPVNPNQYLVSPSEQGVQPTTELEGFFYVNPYQKRVTPISIRSQKFEMSGDEAIQFPSADSFDITLEGFVEWRLKDKALAETYVKYSEGSELLPLVEKTVILPYARSLCRIVGSQYKARDFIGGETKLRFQEEFGKRLREACEAQGVEILQALVRDIVPPPEIKQPIRERENAKERIVQFEQQIKVAQSMSKLATQQELANQNKAVGDANKQVVTLVKQSEQGRDVALTKAQQELAVAKLQLEAAKKQADAVRARGEADAAIVLLQYQAQAEPLRQQVAAFGDGDAYARYFYYQKLAPSIKSILSNTEGPFSELFRQFDPQPGAGRTVGIPSGNNKMSGVSE